MSEEMTEGRRVLIVDDDASIRRTCSRILLRAGYGFEEADGIASARELFRDWATRACAVVLLDLRLEDGWGHELLPAMEALVPRPAVVIVSGYLHDQSLDEMVGRCAGTLAKPFDGETVLHVVDSLLEQRSPESVADRFSRHKSLSRRETQTLRLAIGGASIGEAARQMGCRPGTVGSYWSRIFDKTGRRCQRDVVVEVLRFALQGKETWRESLH